MQQIKAFSKTISTAVALFIAFVPSHAISSNDVINYKNLTPKELIAQHPEFSPGIYHSYNEPVNRTSIITRPEGYTPFYISHYGRHGSRWHSSEHFYETSLQPLQKAYKEGCLTPAGEDLLRKVRILAEDAEGRWGDLSPRGVREHRGIAERMFKTYPEVFEGEARIDSKSTVVIRCVLSMAAFNERLKELNPAIEISRESSQRNMGFMGNRAMTNKIGVFRKAGQIRDSLMMEWVKPERFIKSIFTKDDFVEDNISNPTKWMYSVYMLAGICQDCDYLGLDLYPYFETDELYDLWRTINCWAYMALGPNEQFGTLIKNEAIPLLVDIISATDAAIEGESHLAANLRFGHDTNIVPLLTLMGLSNVDICTSLEDLQNKWNISLISPMANNLQMIFFRSEDSEDVLVRVMHNEYDVQLPLDGAPFYKWTDLKEYLINRIKGLL